MIVLLFLCLPPQGLRLPGYVNLLGPRFLATMRKDVANKTYAAVRGPFPACSAFTLSDSWLMDGGS